MTDPDEGGWLIGPNPPTLHVGDLLAMCGERDPAEVPVLLDEGDDAQVPLRMAWESERDDGALVLAVANYE